MLWNINAPKTSFQLNSSVFSAAILDAILSRHFEPSFCLQFKYTERKICIQACSVHTLIRRTRSIPLASSCCQSQCLIGEGIDGVGLAQRRSFSLRLWFASHLLPLIEPWASLGNLEWKITKLEKVRPRQEKTLIWWFYCKQRHTMANFRLHFTLSFPKPVPEISKTHVLGSQKIRWGFKGDLI